ncbi:unnamed protein product [Rotaria sp. Silwood1]|nr:unnamed protein product [Rotaria sp. Silwood1]
MIIRQHGLSLPVERLKTSFDFFVTELKTIDDGEARSNLIGQMISPLISLSFKDKKLAEVELIQHEFFLILRDQILIEHLRRRHIEGNLTGKILLNVSILFMNLYHNITDTNVAECEHLLLHYPLIDELVKCLNELNNSDKHINDPNLLRSISFLLTALKHLHAKQIINDEYLLLKPLFSAIAQRLTSLNTITMIRNLKRNFTQYLDHRNILFLDTMPLYSQWYSDYDDLEIFLQVLRRLLKEFTDWFTSCSPDSYRHCTTKMGSMIRHFTYFLVRPIESDNLKIFSEEFYDDYCRLVSHWILFLSSTLSFPSNKINTSATRTILQMLYNFTLHLNVLNYMKTMPILIPMLLQMTEVDHVEIQLNAYRCLGKLMREDDIKKMANPSKIACVYIDFITRTIDDRAQTRRFHSLLDSLKNFVQHDQVKTELIKQQALTILIKCIVEPRFDPIKVQLIVLEILLALSFNNDASVILRQNQNFITHIRNLSSKTNSNQTDLQRAAEGLLWKLEKEVEAVAKSTNVNLYKYDIMISYSHKDQDVCLQIHDRLVKDGYNVWLDRDCLRGPTMIGIANAIENSEHVLICMSNTYKQSVYCQSEAHYAYERECRLIPILIESNYKPDGWLGIIVSGKIYVEFGKIDFHLAYNKLKNEISARHYDLLTRSLSRAIEKDPIRKGSKSLELFQGISESIE